MSYILEALKKAQAERQIGSTPTIHAPTLASAPVGQGARGKRAPVIVAMVLMAAAIAGLATMLVRQQPGASQPAAAIAPAAVGQAPVPAAAAPAPVAAAPAASVANNAAPAATAAAPSTAPAATGQPILPQPTATTAQARAAEAPTAQRGSVSQPTGPRPAGARVAEAPQPAPQKQAVNATLGAGMAPASPPPAPMEEQVQSLRELPEPIQRAIPQVTLGGYMYSKNPADRLLLIDKVLRKEGEEVAPGLILDKLQPKQAIFSFRGYRYRVPL
ncbi:general secretion pathway protein GspB [Pseudoduganella sp. HUAS MS19]